MLLIANVVHTSLNARGGGERLSVATIKALAAMGIQVELATIEKPDMVLIREAYGTSIDCDVKKIRTLSLLQTDGGRSGFTVNTHGDMLPFFRRNFTRNNSIAYCHFPIAGHLMDCGDSDYLGVLQNMHLYSTTPGYRGTRALAAKSAYDMMMKNSTVLTNSEFSRRAIFKTFGVDSIVLHPPVDTDVFKNALLSDCRDDSILVISRFHPSKKIENAINLAKLLKREGIGSRMNIIGNMSPDGVGYFNYLQHLVRRCALEDFVRFETNVIFDRLLDFMRTSKVYVHPLPGEPFGISTVEAMSAGVVPVVPDIGGHTEFVPEKYQFHTFSQGVDAVAAALCAPASEQIQLSRITQQYSTANYVKKFQQIAAETFGISLLEQMPVISASKSAV